MHLGVADFMVDNKTIIVDDGCIDLFKNDLLSSRQYLLRITNFNDSFDIRLTKDELMGVAHGILYFVEKINDE